MIPRRIRRTKNVISSVDEIARDCYYQQVLSLFLLLNTTEGGEGGGGELCNIFCVSIFLMLQANAMQR